MPGRARASSTPSTDLSTPSPGEKRKRMEAWRRRAGEARAAARAAERARDTLRVRVDAPASARADEAAAPLAGAAEGAA